MPSGYRTECLHANNPYKLEVDGTTTTNHDTNSYIHYTDGHVSTEIKVWSRNDQSRLSSEPVAKTITTQRGLREFLKI